MTEKYIYKNQKKLRCGYTTGTCAAAAAGAAMELLLLGSLSERICIKVPKGDELQLNVEPFSGCIEELLPSTKCPNDEQTYATCGIRKDSGDDADVTDGMIIYATVWKIPYGIKIDGGIGIGNVTVSGLDQPAGEAAINSVPRKMIMEQIQLQCEKYEYDGGVQVVISAPEGLEISKKTFNAGLGIQGGISILGTSGIVEPMSEKALLDTIYVEIQQKNSQGVKDLLIVPGNYGEEFVKSHLKLDMERAVKCSNYIGDTIDMTYEFKMRSILLVGHIGKIVKLGAGIMNTHSRMADGRMEILGSCAVLAGATVETVKKVLNCYSTDEAIEILQQENKLELTMHILMERIDQHMSLKAYEGLKIGVITFSKKYGLLAMSKNAEELLYRHRI